MLKSYFEALFILSCSTATVIAIIGVGSWLLG